MGVKLQVGRFVGRTIDGQTTARHGYGYMPRPRLVNPAMVAIEKIFFLKNLQLP